MSPSFALLLGILIGAIAGAVAGIWLAGSKTKAEQRLREQGDLASGAQIAALQRDLDRARADTEARGLQVRQLDAGLATQSTLAAERLNSLAAFEQQSESLRQQLLAAVQTEKRQAEEISRLTADLENERHSAIEKLKLLTDARDDLKNQFQTLAGDILEEKSKKFTEQNKTNLDQLLNPLRVQITDFRGKVEEAQKDANMGRAELRTKLESLEKLNQQLTTEAHNLTTALRGSAKSQGDWGEFILRDLLDKAGLREGEQYTFQESFTAVTDEDGARGKAFRTDVILNLPGGRHLVVDSKVSLNAYTDYCSATTDDVRKSHVKMHLASVRAHLDGLSKRAYHKLPGIDSPDFVVMFIPIEPAFLLAMQEAQDLWREAYERSVLLVGPTTLLFVIRIVDNLWQQEQQAKSIQDIVERGTKLYEKFVNFVSDLTKVGESLRSADLSYQAAMNKLSTGSGNLVRQTEMLKKAGIRTNKQLSPKLLETAGIDYEEQAELSLAASEEETPALTKHL
jgi:DNA recombination protein RmuC